MAEKFIALISPAKRIESGVSGKVKEFTRGDFMDEAEYLANKLKKYSAKKISGLMNVSAEIGELNQQRYAEWTPDFTPEIADASILTFKGDVYLGLDAYSLDAEAIDFAQQHLRILSGLYGILRPLVFFFLID